MRGRVYRFTVAALVAVAAEAGPVEPGAEVESVVLVRNTGAVSDEFSVTVQGPAAAWAVVDPPTLWLAPGEEGTSWVRFRPPLSAAAASDATFSVVVASRNDPEFIAIEEGRIEVSPLSALDATLLPPSREGGTWADYQLVLDNVGNRPVTAYVSASDPRDALVLAVDPDSVHVPSGGSATTTVRVRRPRHVVPRRAIDRRFTVTVVVDDVEVAAVDGTLPPGSAVAHELARSAFVLGGLLILLVLLAGQVVVNRPGATGGGASSPSPPTSWSTEEEVPEDRAAGAPETSTADPEAVPEDSLPQPPPPPPPPPPDLPRLVWVRSAADGSKDLVMRAPGPKGGEVRIVVPGSDEISPAVSPDGRSVAFLREQGAEAEVCIIPATGGDFACLAPASPGSSVAWLGGGDKVAFLRGEELWEVAASSEAVGEATRLAATVPVRRFSLSPDGSLVAFATGRKIVVRRVDGSGERDLNVPSGTPETPAWSPEGSRIAYSLGGQIFVAPVAGGTIVQVTTNGAPDSEPVWSRDGRWLAFHSNRSGGGDIYVLRPSGRGPEVGLFQVTDDPNRDSSPAF